MKHILLLLFSLFSFLSVSAQKLDISILSFEMDQFDTSAQAGTQYAEHDKGGELYSIIKVKDAEGDNIPDGFTFDFGTVRTLKHEIHDGDLWVWVQRNAKSVTIRHPEYRTIEKFDLGQTIQPGRVYVMRVTMSRVERVVKSSVRKQVLQFVVSPKDEHATVRVKPSNANEYELWGEVNAVDGSIDRYINYGTYNYQIEADSYEVSYGRVNLSGGETHVERVTLTPNFGYLEVMGDKETNGADIFVDNKKIGTVPYSDTSHHITPGAHRIEIVKGNLFLPYSASFDIFKGQTTRVTPQLQIDFATVTLCAGKDVQLIIDGKSVGTGTWIGPLKSGTHEITSISANHRDATDVITVERGKDVSCTLTSPTPITGSLYVRSTPAGATIKIDGKESGTTPKVYPELLVGRHSIELSLDGYVSEKREVTIAENDEKQLEVALEEYKGVKIGEKYYDVNDNGLVTFEVKGVKFNMVLVEAGSFRMGSATGDNGEKPVHSVTISKDYYIGETEVTQALWKAVTGYSPTPGGLSWKSSYGLGDDYPAYNISYKDVQSFIMKLNQMTGQTFRMPTEAEWEFAAKGGNMSKGYTYSGSNTIDDVAWYTNNSSKSTHPVATKAPNELGIYDMSGNVYEWCSDWYSSYSSRVVTDSTGATSGSYRVRRGGGWGSSAAFCRSASRASYIPADRYNNLGFRLALSRSE